MEGKADFQGRDSRAPVVLQIVDVVGESVRKDANASQHSCDYTLVRVLSLPTSSVS